MVYKFRAIEKILPALKGKSKYGWVAPFAICLLILFTAIGMGIYIDGYGIHPPAQFTGHCPSPAQIKGGSCLLITVQIITVGGSTTAVTITQQAGVIITTTQGH